MKKIYKRFAALLVICSFVLMTLTWITPTYAATKDTYYIKVNRKQNCVTIYSKDEKGKYTVPVKAMACSVGVNNATPTGIYPLKERYRWHELDGKVYGQYCTRITGHILFHSVYYSKTEPNTLSYNAYNQLGTTASHGCVRLCVADAKWIYDNCEIGTTVEIYDGDDVGPLGKPQTIKIGSKSPYRGWDPTDPDPNNPWVFGAPKIEGAKNRTIERCSKSSAITDGVKATDFAKNEIAITVKGKINLNKTGKYQVTYVATDVLGQTTKKTVTLTVKDTVKPTLTRLKKKITISDDSVSFANREELTAYLKQFLIARDSRVEIGKKYITVKDAALWKAYSKQKYGTYEVDVYVKDKAGNKSTVKSITIKYVAPQPKPEEEPKPEEPNTDEHNPEDVQPSEGGQPTEGDQPTEGGQPTENVQPPEGV